MNIIIIITTTSTSSSKHLFLLPRETVPLKISLRNIPFPSIKGNAFPSKIPYSIHLAKPSPNLVQGDKREIKFNNFERDKS
jgi:hypothetical protein